MFNYGSLMFRIETSSGRVGHRAMKTSAGILKAGRRHGRRGTRAVLARCSME
jgi:hypothetical protein